jgi:predicted RecA/RadA family phage recombinase
MAEASYINAGNSVNYTAAADVAAGQVLQLSDGRAAVATTAIASGATGSVLVSGRWKVAKTASIVLLAGGRVYWDHSANTATYKPVNDRDFYIGTVAADAASADAEVTVYLNECQQNTIDAIHGASLSVATGTSAAGGFGLPGDYGGAKGLILTATNEAQCVDLLSVDRVAIAANPIVEAIVRLGANGSTSAVDFNIGLANGTSATDADAITESVFFHVDGGSLDILAESDDGTTEVNATDTTVDITAGSAVANRFEFWIDARDPASVKMYVNGVRVLSGSTFKIDAATGPLGLLAHLEKTSSTATAGPVYIDHFTLRTMEA